MIVVERALASPGHAKQRMSELFVDGFGMHFTYFSRDRAVLTRAFAHMFVPEVFYVASLDQVIVGMGALTTLNMQSLEPGWRDLSTHFGLLKGTLAYFVLRREFHKPALRTGRRIASVEFVATDPAYQGRGVASALIQHFLANTDYDEFILEVADTNRSAIHVYQKHGFVEFTRIKTKHADQSGVNFLIYMSYRRS